MLKVTACIVFSILTLQHLSVKAQSKVLLPEQMQKDINILKDSWTSLHPGLYRYNTPGAIQNYFKDILKDCSVPQSEKKFYLLLSQLATKIRCGHTYLNPNNLKTAIAKRVFHPYVIPFLFRVVNNKIIITHNLSAYKEIKAGDEITAINGISVNRIIDSLLTVSRADGKNALVKQINNINETPDEATKYSLFDIYFPLFFPPTDSLFNVTVKDFAHKKISRYTTSGLSINQRSILYTGIFGEVPKSERSWDYRIVDNKTAYMKFGTFAFWNSNFNTQHYIDSIFAHLFQHPEIANLVIDIRGNEGGDNTGNYILSYITPQKIACEGQEHRCYRYLNITDSLLPYLETWDNDFKKPKDPAKFFKNEIGLWEKIPDSNECDVIIPKQKVFKGKIYLLIDAKNSSAGYEMARDFKNAKLGISLGETTGGSQQGINGSEFFFLKLPESGIEIDLPLVYNYYPNKPDRGIDPDKFIGQTQASIANNRDVLMEYILKNKQKK